MRQASVSSKNSDFRLFRRAFCITGIVLMTMGRAKAAAHGNDQGKAEIELGRTRVTVVYGRPELEGRHWKTMIQPGQLWRLGASIPTTLETDGPLRVGGKTVPKGKYYLMAWLIQPNRWSLLIAREPFYHFEPSAKVAEEPLVLSESKRYDDKLTITLARDGTQGIIRIAWGKDRLTARLEPAS